MKRFFSVILAIAMLASTFSVVFAENGQDNTNGESVVTSDNIIDDNNINEENTDLNIDEQSDTNSEENAVSPLADDSTIEGETDEKDAGVKVYFFEYGASKDTYYFDTFDNAFKFISGLSNTQSNIPKVYFLKDCTLNKTYDFKNNKVKFYGNPDNKVSVNVNVNFLSDDGTMLDSIFKFDGGCVGFLDSESTPREKNDFIFKDITKYTAESKRPESFIEIKSGIPISGTDTSRDRGVIGSNTNTNLKFENFGCTNGVFNIEDSCQEFEYVTISGTQDGYPDVVVKGTNTKLDGAFAEIPTFCLADKNSSLILSTSGECKNYSIVTRENLYTDSTKKTNDVLVTNAAKFTSNFTYTAYDASGSPTKMGVTASDNDLVVTTAPAGHLVTVTDPIYSAATYPGSSDMKIGTINVTGANNLDSVPEGTELTLSIAINSSYTDAKNHSFVKWVVTTENGREVSVTDNKFTMPGEAVTVTAEFIPNIKMTFYAGGTYASDANECTDCTWNDDGSITYTMPGSKGTLTISTPKGFKEWTYPTDDETKTPTVTSSDVVTVTVNTNEGYTFNGIKSVQAQQNSKLTGTINNSGSYSFSVPAGKYTDYRGGLTAQIILDINKQQYNITKSYNPDEGSVQVVYKYEEQEIDKAYWGSSIWIGVEPKENYKIKAVKVIDKDNKEVSLDTTYVERYKTWAFTMPASDVTVTVEFELDACGITIAPCEYGTVTTNPSGTATVGSEVTITATPDTNYELDILTVTTASGTAVTVTDNKFTMPNESVTVSATFKKKQFSITAAAAENGTISIIEPSAGADGTYKSKWGENVKINVKPNVHYEIDTVTVGGSAVPVDAQGDYTFEMPANDVEITAVFKKVKYTITGQGEHVKFGIPNADTFDWGDPVEITVTPDKWYSIQSVTADNQTVNVTRVEGKDNTYSFTMPQGNITITAAAERPNFNVEFVSNGGSSVDGQVIANGNTVTKPSTPTYVNHGFAGWYTSPTFEADTKYDFSTNVTGNVKLYARWFLWGDVNGDGKVTPFDAVQLDRCYVGNINVESLVVPIAARVTDANKTKPTPFDSVQIRRKYVGSLDRFPVEKTSYEYDLENNKVITE